MVPLGLGYMEGVTHDDICKSTTVLLAALKVATGNMLRNGSVGTGTRVPLLPPTH